MSRRVRLHGAPCVDPDRIGCDRTDIEARGCCTRCYGRKRANGTELPPLAPRLAAIDRLMSFVVLLDTGCWGWLGKVSKQNGYAHFWFEGRTVGAHWASFMLHTGTRPIGQVDHTCHNDAVPLCALGKLCPHRACSNPDHLRDVSAQVNTLSSPVNPARINADKTWCAQGHEYTPENTYRSAKQRHCRTCGRKTKRGYRAEPKEVVLQ